MNVRSEAPEAPSLASARAMVRLDKIKGAGKMRAAIRHNHRAWAPTRQNLDHVDPRRTHLNALLRGAELPSEVQALQQARMATLSKTVRKDAVLAIEILVSLPCDLQIDEARFFRTSVSWIAQRFGADNVISAVVHNDEGAPHLHALVVPIQDGCLKGSAMLGYRAGFRALLHNFQVQVAGRFGLVVHQPISGAVERRAAAAAVLDKLRSDGDPALESAVFRVIERYIASKPEPFLTALGLRLRTPEWAGQTAAELCANTPEREESL
jgi:hypothetical protein